MEIIRLKDISVEERKGYSIKRLFTEKLSCVPENAGFYETTIPAGSICSHHYHENIDEFIIFLTQAKMRAEKEIYNLETGDIVILKPYDKHEFIAENNPIKLIAIKLPNLIDDKIEC